LRSYSDVVAGGYSPDLVGAISSRLGVSPAMASLPGAAASALFGSFQGTFGNFAEKVTLSVFRMDAEAAGISLTGVDLVPLRLHDNHAEFAPLYGAWTNSSTRMYINLDDFWKSYQSDISNGFTEDDALANMRGAALCTIRHEFRHVKDFRSNQDKPPDDFKEMIDFEEKAYGEFITWIGQASVKKYLVDQLGAYDQIISDQKNGATKNRAWFKSRLNLTSAKAKLAMVADDAKFLPQSIRGREDYGISDLYQTKAP
jgi:hypothetical protein